MLTVMADAVATPIHTRHHAVQFYGDELSLFTTVSSFLSEGLVAGQPAIVIGTETHRVAIVEHLSRRFIDVERAQHVGDLLLLDARETLDKFLVGKTPDPELFERHVGSVVEQMLRGRPRTIVRAYGEMVDALWKDGLAEAAIKLEILWNKLVLKHGFSLLCGYAMGSFYKQSHRVDEICQQHTQVIKPDMNVLAFKPKRVRSA